VDTAIGGLNDDTFAHVYCQPLPYAIELKHKPCQHSFGASFFDESDYFPTKQGAVTVASAGIVRQ
jgi:hypothetical protein